jgi:hypothetical protein
MEYGVMHAYDLFKHNISSSVFYSDIRNETQVWHKEAKTYWNDLFSKYRCYLDTKFIGQMSCDPIACLWELTLLNYFDSQTNMVLLQIPGKKKNIAPEYCVSYGNTPFYVEATSPDVGSSGLAIPFRKFIEASKVDADEYMQQYRTRIINSFSDKAKKYKKFIDEKGGSLVIAITMAKVPLLLRVIHKHQYIIELSCFFNLSPYGGLEEFIYKDNAKNVKIETNLFETDKYSYVSAVLISYSDIVFFPDREEYGCSLQLGSCKNDFLLVHNPRAPEEIRLPYGILPIATEKQIKKIL